MSSRAPARRAAASYVFAAALLSLLFLDHTSSGWGVHARVALVFAVVDHGTLAIDAYHETHPTTTYDKAYFDGHYYSDKIIGVSLLAMPVYAVMRAIGPLVGWEPDFHTKLYVLRVFAVSIPAAFSLALLWLLMLRLGAPPRRALLAVAFAFWGSLWFGFSSSFFPYSPGIAATLAALWILLSRPSQPLDLRRHFGVGALCGFAILCDMIFGLMVVGLGLVYLLRLAHDLGFRAALPSGVRVALTPHRHPRAPCAALRLGVGALGGFLPLSIFLAYSVSIFGTPTIPYEYTYLAGFHEGMSQGFMGITTPKPGALWFLTLHPHRGIFFWSPWLVLALAGFWMGLQAPGVRRLCAALGVWALVSHLVFNASYYMWWGGFGMGSRFLLPMFAVVPLGLAEILRSERSPGWFWALVLLGILSVALNAPLSILEPEIPTVNDYFALLNVTPSTRLVAPQFEYLRVFYSPELFFRADQGLAGDWILGLASVTLAPLVLLVAAARMFRDEPAGSNSDEPSTPPRPPRAGTKEPETPAPSEPRSE